MHAQATLAYFNMRNAKCLQSRQRYQQVINPSPANTHSQHLKYLNVYIFKELIILCKSNIVRFDTCVTKTSPFWHKNLAVVRNRGLTALVIAFDMDLTEKKITQKSYDGLITLMIYLTVTWEFTYWGLGTM